MYDGDPEDDTEDYLISSLNITLLSLTQFMRANKIKKEIKKKRTREIHRIQSERLPLL